MKSLFIFHRDLSINDNIGLFNCINKSDEVHCIFIFTPEQANPSINKYFNSNSFSFMIESLQELSKDIHISFFYKNSVSCIKNLIKLLYITDVWENRDFSPFAKKREELHAKLCESLKVKYNLCESITLAPMGTFIKNKNTYVKFTPFYNFAKSKKICNPVYISSNDLKKISKKIKGDTTLVKIKKNLDRNNLNKNISGGRIEAIKLMQNFAKIVKDYEKYRNYPYINSTSHLGSYLHFGVISPREVYYFIKQLGNNKGSSEFIKQLYWREFYMYISNYITKNYDKKSWTMPKFNLIKWNTNKKDLTDWQYGKTGIPIIDAGMRELLNTGVMHNRLRMICAMYLIHYLGIHWKEGEKWFAKKLTDYSYANNWGGWVWCSGFEVHSNPYFRIFSIEEQHKRFDPNCIYIQKWIPEFRKLSNKEIFNIYRNFDLSEIRLERIKYLKQF
jgi:deoxyribodipyrimidine photo-lyase